MIEIYTDGSSTGKVGDGGWAYAVIQDNKVIAEDYGSAKETTNNRMELQGAIEGARYLYTKVDTTIPSVLYCDSQYVVKGINEWFSKWEEKIARGKTIKNQDLWLELRYLTNNLPNCRLAWIRGHIGIKYNEYCDKLAKKGKLEAAYIK